MKRTWTFMMSIIAIATFGVACSSSGGNPASQAALTATTSQPAASPSVATSAPAPKEFVSQRYGFSVTLTGDWLEEDASIDWDGAHLQGTASSSFANFPTTDRTLVVGAAPAPEGTTLAQWRAAMVAAAPSGCSESPSAEETTLGGGPALAWTTVCINHANVNKLAALHGTRGYIFFLASSWNDDKTTNSSTFDSIRQSFRFTS